MDQVSPVRRIADMEERELNGFKDILVERLESKGIELRVVPGYVRSLANTLSSSPHMSSREVNKRLQRLGWNDFELDEHTFQLAKAVLEGERFAEKGYEPPVWFKRPFGRTMTTIQKIGKIKTVPSTSVGTHREFGA